MGAGEQVIDYGRLVVRAAREVYPQLWATVARDFPHLPEHERARIVSLVTGVCHSCYAAASDCQCWNDE